MFDVKTVSLEWGGKTLTLETGHIARQADGAVLATYGETVVLCAVTAARNLKEGQDFFPLTVHYQEKFSAAGRIPVIAGTGSNNTVEAIRFMRHAHSVGADAALVVTPYYNKPTQGGMIAHFTALHECCELPIIIYNIPGRSAVDMLPDTMGALSKLPRIIGVKDATNDLARVAAQRLTCGKDFLQISGEDPIAHGFNAAGGVGVISVTANVAPRLVAQVQEATLAGDFATALELQDRLMPLHRAIFTEPGLVGVKYAMSRLGLCSDEVRLPLVGLDEATKALVDHGLRHAGLLV
jgi:4-hydroxy-tetrahydrodipicolinate synthase